MTNSIKALRAGAATPRNDEATAPTVAPSNSKQNQSTDSLSRHPHRQAHGYVSAASFTTVALTTAEAYLRLLFGRAMLDTVVFIDPIQLDMEGPLMDQVHDAVDALRDIDNLDSQCRFVDALPRSVQQALCMWLSEPGAAAQVAPCR